MEASEPLAVFAIAATVILSFAYFFFLEKIKDDKGESTHQHKISLYILRKTGGFLVFGIVPSIIGLSVFKINLAQTGLVTGDLSVVWPWIAGVFVLILLLNMQNSKSAGLQAMYPELRLEKWDPISLAIHSGGWVIYLAGYEFLFRGLLLFSCYNAFGLWPAVVINLALYSALHLPKGLKEATAAIPFGAFLCYVTISSHSILPAILIHSLQAISCDLWCIHRNPGMNFDQSKNSQP
jgi:membrane protease YdiL (CAAX protease family)